MSGFGADVEGGMHDTFAYEDGITRTEDLFLVVDPLLDGALDAGDRFFLVGVFVEVVSLAGEKFDIDEGDVLGAGGGRTAEPSEITPFEFFGGGVGSEDEFAHDLVV